MRSSAALARTDFTDLTLAGRLDSARGAVERRFLQAGDVLAEAAESLGRLVTALDGLVEALAAPAALDDTVRLRDAAEALLTLPDRHAERLAVMAALRTEGAGLATSVEDMKRHLAYLRVFASSIRITAAGISSASREFGDFAQDICARVEQGHHRLGAFEDELAALLRLFDAAHKQEAGLANRCAAVLPAVPESLRASASEMAGHHARIAEVARQVAGLGRSVQGKIGVALGGLQVGDITRQRIEHVAEILARAEAVEGLDDDRRARFTAFVNALLAEQLRAASAEFHHEIERLRLAMQGLAGDASDILGLRDLALGREAGGDGILHRLEADMAKAQLLVGDMAEAARQALELGDAAALAASKLGRGIVELQDVKTDVQHMAVNTALKCARIGDEGKPLAVIAVELRHHSGQIETLTLSALAGLDAVSDRAAHLSDGAGMGEAGAPADGASEVGAMLDQIRAGLRQTSETVEADLNSLASQGEAVAAALRSAAASLDLRQEIGAVLDAEAEALTAAADPDPSRVDDLEAALGDLLAWAAGRYTMASERDVHAALVAGLTFELPASRPAVAAAQAVEDVLF